MKELEKRKQRLLDQYTHRKRDSDSSSLESLGHLTTSKKSSVGSMETPPSPPHHKRVVRLQEFEEGDTSETEQEASHPDRHTHYSPGQDKVSEMEKRVKEELEVELTPQRLHPPDKGEELGGVMVHHNWPKRSGSSSPLVQPTIEQMPLEKWNNTHHSPSSPKTISQPYMTHFPSLSLQTSLQLGQGGGKTLQTGPRVVSHSDSNEWTDFACASVSGSSVEVGGPLSSRPSSGEGSMSSTAANMAEFDPISCFTSASGDRSKH